MTMRAPAAILAAIAGLTMAMGPTDSARGQGGRYPVAQALHTARQAAPGGRVQTAELVDAHGNPAVLPAQYCEGCPPGYGYDVGYGYGNPTNAAFGGVGFGPDQVGPHYFDINVEYVALTRDSLFNNVTPFTALGFTDGIPPNIILTSEALDLDFEPGFRVTGRYDIGPLSVLEFGYTGVFSMNDAASVSAQATLPNGFGGDLFSPFTNFGGGFLPETVTDPVEGGFDPADLEDFEETDRASLHTIAYDSDLQTAEINYRRYWVGFSPRVSGTLLAGFRYTNLSETFRFDTVGIDFAPGATAPPDDPNLPPGIGTATNLIASDNDLAGFQLGGDIWMGIVQGLRLGAEGKVGLYNNSYEISNTFTTSDGDPVVFDTVKNNHAAFISEARLNLVADILPSLSVRGGYEVLFLNSVALVGDNFNPSSPFDNPNVPDRQPLLFDQGNALFHGWNVGFEYIW